METKVVLFVFSFSIPLIQSSQNVNEKLPDTFPTTYHSPANEVSSSFYFTQNLQPYETTHGSLPLETNRKSTLNSNTHASHPQHSSPVIQIHYSPTPMKTHPYQSSPEQYLPPFKFNSQPPQAHYLPSYFETSTTAPKYSTNNFLYNQYLPAIKSYPTPPSTHYLPSTIPHYHQLVTPSNQIDTIKIQNPFFSKEYHEINRGEFPVNNYPKTLSSIENPKKVFVTPKITKSARPDLGTISTPKPLQFSHAGGTVSHMEFSSADVNYKW